VIGPLDVRVNVETTAFKSETPSTMSKIRADLVLVDRGLFDSRAKARAAIEAGGVRVAGQVLKKPSELIEPDAPIEAVAAHPYVGRGALKLEHALNHWPIRVKGRRVIDVGASTGGFTEVCLIRGAARVYAVDVGQGQLHPRLASDGRVVNLERTDARNLDRALIDGPITLVVCDASFIGLAKVLPAALDLAEAGADLIALIKPQFEAGPDLVGKGGIVRDEATRQATAQAVEQWLGQIGWTVRDRIESPITGGDGNVEYLVWAVKG
jgi:23S rRNA (cytidine1920-2'-O)/16S rRNA (cytidine1409-2'-O)-methyltransferase